MLIIPIAAISYAIKHYGLLSEKTIDKNEVILNEKIRLKIFNYLYILFIVSSVVNFVSQYIIYQEASFASVLALSIFFIAIAIVLKLISTLKISDESLEELISMAFALIIPIITFIYIKYGGTTIWALAFVLMFVCLLFNKRLALISVFASALYTQLFIWSVMPLAFAEVNQADYFVRICILIFAAMLAFYVNNVYVTRLKENAYQIRFQKLISDISYEFVSVNTLNINEKMYAMLEQSGRFIGVDRAYIVFLNQTSGNIDYACEWINPDITPRPASMSDAPQSIIEGLIKRLDSGSVLKLDDVQKLPPQMKSLRDHFLMKDIRAVMSLPIKLKDLTIGFLGFSSSKVMKQWDMRLSTPLGIIANIAADAILKINAEKEINYMAYYDQLTGLPNRLMLKQKIDEAIRNAKFLSIVFVDLDAFKAVNDSMGHDIGDELLIKVSNKLTASTRKNDLVARLGGDEFVVLLDSVEDEEDVRVAVDDIMSAFKSPVILKGQEFFITASAGVTLYPRDGSDAEELIRNADMAMYNAKTQGKNRYIMCSENMKNEINEKNKLTNLLYRAQERGQLVLYYQPQVMLETNQIIGLEALLRWDLPEMGLIAPSTFIPLAERTALINPIGEWVLREACIQNKLWQDMGFPKVRMAVNVSVNQLRDPQFASQVEKVIKETGLSPEYLELEITESVACSQVDNIIAILNNLKKIGVMISIDDFGTEYSSLNRLKMMPIDRIKMDMQFVRDIDGNNKDRAITKVIINLAKSLGIKILAEGVETTLQLDFLNERMCDEVQGFYFYKPMPATEIENIFKGTAVIIQGRKL